MAKHVKNMTHRKLLLKKQGTGCCYCGVHMTIHNTRSPRYATVEHLRRKADGGGHDLDNKALACSVCNNGRGALDWLTYKSLKMGELQPKPTIASGPEGRHHPFNRCD